MLVMRAGCQEKLSDRAVAIVLCPTYSGGDFVLMPPKGKSITHEHVSKNYVWLQPLVQLINDRIPSNYMVADVFVELDIMLDGCLLQNAAKTLSDDAKKLMAVREAKFIKALLQHLRCLCSCVGGS